MTLFEEASKAWDVGDLKRAFDLFLKAAEDGDPSAQNNIGYFFDVGLGIQSDKERAKYWYEMAAKNGEISSFSNLAEMYIAEGHVTEAKFWLDKAVALGDGDSALVLAKLYLNHSLPTTENEARKYLELALGSGSVTQDSLDEARELLQKSS